jgi:RNA polymerase sigma-70 factor
MVVGDSEDNRSQMSRAPAVSPSQAERLHRKCSASRWDVPVARFHETLEASVAHAFAGGHASSRDVDRYLESLHLEDLALACACAAAHEAAWEHFVREYRPVLYRSADAIDPAGGAREVADSLYAELFGVRDRPAETRQSLFRYFHGRSSLATWLRAVLSQRFVDRLRAGRRLEPLPDHDASTLESPSAEMPNPDRPGHVAAMQSALAAAIAALPPRDRLRLSCYYGQDLTLAEIGRLLKEHESTVSRQLARTRQLIRDAVVRCLREEHRLDHEEVAQCLESVTADAGSLDLAEVLGATPARKIGGGGRS